MEIKKLNKNDDNVYDISKIIALSWKAAYANMLPKEYLNSIKDDKWVEFLNENSEKVLIIKVEKEIVGVCAYGKSRDNKMSDWGEIFCIYLSPNYYRKGLGKKLFAASVKELLNSGYKKIYLWVIEENYAARNFYEKNGFHWNKDVLIEDVCNKKLLRYVYYSK